ncbi:hypothetical protein [Undibacterium sp. Ji49W]|uniref:hypothetical protein n=1 Tax=Undibacterium sp. Ji49W TaxID=3413040 RepID=UPI003BF20929
MNKFNRPVIATSLLALALVLSACGGGGSSTPTTSSAISAVAANSSRQFNGQAAKGRITGARVQAFSLDASGKKVGTAFADTITASDGGYTISVPAGSSSFLIEVGNAPGAFMYDEATQVNLPFPDELRLRSVVKQGANPEPVYWGGVTPLTELIVQVAEKAGGLTAGNIDRARAGVQALLGFDPQRVAMVQATSDSSVDAYVDEKLQALSLTAISQLALDKAFSCNADSQGKRVVCVVSQIANAGKLDGNTFLFNEDVRLALRSALEKVTVDGNLNKSGKTSVDGVGTFISGSLPAPAPETDKVAATRQFFSSLRNNIYSLTNGQQNGAIDMRLNAVKADFEKASAPMDKDLLIWSKTLTEGIDQFNKFKAGTSKDTSVNGLFYGATALWSGYQNVGNLGDCSVMRDKQNVARTPAEALALECRFSRVVLPGTFKASYRYQVEWVEIIDRVWLEPVAGDTGKFSYKSELVQQKTVFGWNQDKFDFIRTAANDANATVISGYSTNAFTGQISYAMQGKNVTALIVDGLMPPRTDGNGKLLTDFESWNLRVDRNDTADGFFRYDFSGELKSYVSSQVSARLAIEKGSYAKVSLDSSGKLAKFGAKEFALLLTGEAGKSKVHGELKLSNASADKNGLNYAPNRIDFTGVISNSTGLATALEFFNGKLSVERFGYTSFDNSKPETANNFARTSAAIVGVIQLPDRPPLKLNVSGSSDAFNSSSMFAQYDDGSNVINANLTDSPGKTRVLRVSSATGVSFDLYGSNEVADILKDGAKVGWLDLKAGRISYVDGSFESIK